LRRFRFRDSSLVLGGMLLIGYGRVARAECHPTACDEAPKNHVLLVADTVPCKNPHASKTANNQITWCSADGTNLQIFFDAPTPFPGLKQLKPNQWISGPISRDATDGKTYKYRAFLDGKEIDPNVIIDH
jgi:hypothetical protein